MKIKAKDLIGPALDWVVALCEGKDIEFECPSDPWSTVDGIADQPLHRYTPSTDWSQGGPIIERDGIQLFVNRIIGTTESGIELDERDGWKAYRTGRYWQTQPAFFGSTPLIAAMRCYCCATLGDEFDIPQELQPCQQPNL